MGFLKHIGRHFATRHGPAGKLRPKGHGNSRGDPIATEDGWLKQLSIAAINYRSSNRQSIIMMYGEKGVIVGDDEVTRM